MRKSPVRHRVKSHRRKNRLVKSFLRGHGTKFSTVFRRKKVTPIGFQSWRTCKEQELKNIKKLGIERGIKPLVNAINKHPFMIAVSSCEGHEERGEEFQYAYVNFLVRRKDRSKIMKIFDEEVLAYKGVEFEDRTKEFSLSDFSIAGFPQDALYITIRIDNKIKRRVVPLLSKKVREI